ncbi:MAG: InlB B-repeat-containing protein [Clostridia bacterium]|nr:InlB B-repeat-containing protein [Clostridia bacterium]
MRRNRLSRSIISTILSLVMISALVPVIHVSAAEGWAWPCPDARYYSSGEYKFGWRWGRHHHGVDIAGGATGTRVVATRSGILRIQPYSNARGNHIVIDHEDGYYSVYQHLLSFASGIHDDMRVYQGQTIGYVGSSGQVTGPHLHFEIHKDTPNNAMGILSKYKENYPTTDVNPEGTYINPNDSPHTHNWEYVWDWDAHPHYHEYRCTTCGEIKTDRDNPVYKADCEICNPPKPQPPSAPTIKISNANIAVGKSVTVSWGAVDKATSYEVSFTNSSNSANNKTATTSGTSTTVILDKAGSYTVRVKAKNESGSSGNSNSVTVMAHDPSTVTFVDYDDSVIESKQVAYGDSATAPAKTPEREGYTFTGWDKTFSKITTDTTVKAQYKINTYTVRFYDRNGSVLDTQRIDYSDSAIPPVLDAPVGYTFAGWDSDDYQFVKKDLIVRPVFLWENNELPIKFTTEPTVTRNEMGTGYTASVHMYNYPDASTIGKVVVVLKTSEGKMVASKTEAFSLSADQNDERSIFVPYDGVASKAEVTAVAVIDNDRTGVPISEKVDIDVDLNLEWSPWSITKPVDNGSIEIEERKEYRYKRKGATTVSESSSLSDGWVFDYSDYSENYWGSWSGYSRNNPSTGTSTRQVQSRYISPEYKTQYNYSGYKGWNAYGNYRWHFCPSLLNNMGYSADYIESGWTDSDVGLTYFSSSQWCSDHGTFYGYYDYGGQHYYYKGSRSVVSRDGYNEWRYRDKKKSYHYFKWNYDTEWTTDAPAEIESNYVKLLETSDGQGDGTRTVYRYKSTYSSDMEDNEGEVRNISGQIENAEDGKQVTLYIFKGTNTDPTESQLEYVAQSTLSDGGQYSFDYIAKEEPTDKTGDFIIMIGIEGADSPFYVDRLKAPTPEYKVQFMVDGEAIDTQTVSEGDSAIVPNAPDKDGYTFVGWDSGTTNVRDDMAVNAIYIPNKYTVVFLDWNNQTVYVKTFSHGDEITVPDANGKEGAEFAGWDKIIEGTKTVTDNMILTAVYNSNKYDVVFYDDENNIVSKQTVEYGGSAEIPGGPSKEGFVFDEWSGQEQLSFITDNVSVYPVFKYEQTSDAPSVFTYEAEDPDNVLVMITSNNDDDSVI